jgi:hypothetical protein
MATSKHTIIYAPIGGKATAIPVTPWETEVFEMLRGYGLWSWTYATRQECAALNRLVKKGVAEWCPDSRTWRVIE